MKRRGFSIFRLLCIAAMFVLAVYLLRLFVLRPVVNTPDQVNVPTQTTSSEDDGKNSYEGFTAQLSNTHSSNWKLTSNVGQLNTQIISGVRDKRTKIVGNNNDVMTIMVYMCGSDLESKNAMGVYDLVEMANAKLSDKINLLVYTGGSKQWHTDSISARYNQIYKVVGDGKIQCLVENAGTGAMVDPDNLTSFIEFGTENYEANRYALIFWDHGGGTVSGYGYDEKYPRAGSMSLAQIDKALTNADVTFDFVGFDCCLMATTETALMLTEHADYMIGSEEAEPGIGWYYTDWLSNLSRDTSMSTLQIGKNIADDFVRKCRSDTPGQIATLSLIDLAELEYTIPERLSAFSEDTTNMINQDYRTVAYARSGAREFASDTRIDMVDMVGLSANMNTDAGNELAQALMSAIKYNNSNVSDAYGLSVYFPYRTTKYLSTVLDVYDDIDMNEDYSNCIRSFASYQGAGQISSGGSHYAYQSTDGYDSSSGYYSSDSADVIFQLFDLFLNGGYSSEPSYSDYYGYDMGNWWDRNNSRQIAEYIAKNHFDADLKWKNDKITLSDEQWSLVDRLLLNMFIDDGKGYIELGKDALYDFDDDRSLLKMKDMTWIVASADNENWQFVPYYHLYATDDGEKTIYTGRIPVRLNGDYADLLVNIDDEDMNVVGYTYDYRDDSDVVAKSLYELNENDEIEFVCDYYDYEGNYDSAYILGEKLIVKDKVYLGDMPLDDYKTLAQYEFVDIYQQSYWSEAIR
jgi:hypothetical protein